VPGKTLASIGLARVLWAWNLEVTYLPDLNPDVMDPARGSIITARIIDVPFAPPLGTVESRLSGYK
jgi:hypothetical protein